MDHHWIKVLIFGAMGYKTPINAYNEPLMDHRNAKTG
jgi:hypothetical protein